MAGNKLQGINQYTKLVNPDGTGTEFFIRLLQGKDNILGPLGQNAILAGSGISLDGGDGLLANGDVTIKALASAILDQLGATRGDILYRDASAWEVLAPGTAGEFLKTGGAGANPVWAAGGGGGGAMFAAATMTFNGSSDPTILDSKNIATITRISAGYFEATFTTAAPDGNYGIVGSAVYPVSGANLEVPSFGFARPDTPTTTKFRFATAFGSGGFDCVSGSFMVFYPSSV